MANFEDMVELFNCSNKNRGVVRLNFNEAALLWKAVLWSDRAILEIGRMYGGSTALIKGAAGPRRVVSIDMENRLSVDPELIKGVEILVGDSSKPIAGHWGLLFIDGDHSFEGCLKDVKAHWDNVVEEGLVAFHDAMPNDGIQKAGGEKHLLNYCVGVKKVVDRLLSQGVAIEVAQAGSMIVLEKTGELGTALDGLV